MKTRRLAVVDRTVERLPREIFNAIGQDGGPEFRKRLNCYRDRSEVGSDNVSRNWFQYVFLAVCVSSDLCVRNP